MRNAAAGWATPGAAINPQDRVRHRPGIETAPGSHPGPFECRESAGAAPAGRSSAGGGATVGIVGALAAPHAAAARVPSAHRGEGEPGLAGIERRLQPAAAGLTGDGAGAPLRRADDPRGVVGGIGHVLVLLPWRADPEAGRPECSAGPGPAGVAR